MHLKKARQSSPCAKTRLSAPARRLEAGFRHNAGSVFAAERLLQLLAYKRPGTPFGYPASFFQNPLQRGVVQQVHGFKLSFVKYGPVVENTR